MPAVKYWAELDESRRADSGHGHWSYPLLGEENGCVRDCMSGISYYTDTCFTPVATHPFQEGFLVLSGTGDARVGGETFPLTPMRSFLVPAGVEHTLRSASAAQPLVLFWFHAQG